MFGSGGEVRGSGWLIEVEPSDSKQVDSLLTADAYDQVVKAAK
jgi:glycine cleavage system H lipoate-binding protein